MNYLTGLAFPKWALASLLAISAGGALAQDSATPASPMDTETGNYFSDWFARVTRIQSEQPHWITPLTTVTPRLEEELRYDQSFETAKGENVDTYGGKGLELIPYDNVEVILGIPAWVGHSKESVRDGFADENFLVKYRVASANEENGNYILTAFLGLGVPTGIEGISAGHYIVTPTIAGGKGWGDFDVQSTLGVGIPDDGSARIGPGMPVALNTAFQYRALKVLWPEFEVNYTYYANGEHEGKNQVFLTPGFLMGRFPIWDRVGFTVGVGYQVAVTEAPTYNHNFIVSARIPF